jgi:hypothetical protein
MQKKRPWVFATWPSRVLRSTGKLRSARVLLINGLEESRPMSEVKKAETKKAELSSFLHDWIPYLIFLKKSSQA